MQADVFSESDPDRFRQAVRQFVRDKLPADLRQTIAQGRQAVPGQLIVWHELLAAHGILVPHWPVAWGGRGWSVTQQLIFDEEMALGGAPELNSITFDMIGPVLMRFGSADQQQRFLPAIASGRQWWCQGYSEPNAGSDLAALTTRAYRDRDHYVIDGSKIWTSYAQYADWIFVLARTKRDGRPQEGISFFLVDMRAPGITVRPITGIHGWSVFCEVFFDKVNVPVHQLVGHENQGWTVAKSLLEFERLKLARIGENKRRMARVREIALSRTRGGCLVADMPWFRARFADLVSRLMALEANAARFVARQSAGEQLGPEVSMLKMRGSRLIQLWEELMVDALGPQAWPLSPQWLAGQPDAPPQDALAGTASSRRFLARGYTIAGGTSEIQHNIIAKQVLAL